MRNYLQLFIIRLVFRDTSDGHIVNDIFLFHDEEPKDENDIGDLPAGLRASFLDQLGSNVVCETTWTLIFLKLDQGNVVDLFNFCWLTTWQQFFTTNSFSAFGLNFDLQALREQVWSYSSPKKTWSHGV